MTKLLIVDDNQQNLYLLQVLLSAHGYDVDLASNGAEALERARCCPPHLILSDILMPVMDGFTLCHNWMQDPQLNAIPFIFYTATYTDPQDEAFALSLGVAQFLIKPMEPEKLLAVLRETLTEHAKGKPASPRPSIGDGEYIQQYNAALVRKLEDKLLQVEETNAALERDIAERMRVEEQLKASLAEKQVLLRELYHRTKNTLQVIRSMLVLQAAKTPANAEVQKLVRDAENRILAISLVHQKLYQSHDLSRINIAEYLEELAQLILKSYRITPQSIALAFDIEALPLLLDTAIPCGLIVHELLSNAIRHAFVDGRNGEIAIKLFRNAGGKLELHIGDNGVGVPQGFNFRQQQSLGLQMAFAIAEHQMQGTVRVTGDNGVRYVIEFPDTLYQERV